MVGSELEFNSSTGFVEPYRRESGAERQSRRPSAAPADVEADVRAR
jgi:hypothetical protein